MKKTIQVLLCLLMTLVLSFNALAFASDDSGLSDYEFLVEQSGNDRLRIDAVPSSQGSLPFTAEWNSVTSYTNTSKYFTGYTGYAVSLDVGMSNAGTSGRFYVDVIEVGKSSGSGVIDSNSAKFSFSTNGKYSAITGLSASKKYYFKFRIGSNSGRGCWGVMKIIKL